MNRIRTLIVASIGALAVTTAAYADGHIEGAIKARQAQMTLYAFNIGTLGAMAKGEMDYDAEAAGQAAANLAALTRVGTAAMWPQGSDSDSVMDSAALPDMWANFADVGAKAGDLTAAADAMASAAGGGLDGLRAAMGPLGGACQACHKVYRKKRE